MINLLIILLLSPTSVFSQETARIAQQNVVNAFKSLNVVKAGDFSNELKKSLKLSDQFISQKKKDCESEFTSVELEESGEVKKLEKPLSKEERQLCFRELKLFQKEILDLSYDSRRSFAIKLHEGFLLALEKQRIDSKEALDRAYERKNHRNKRSRSTNKKN